MSIEIAIQNLADAINNLAESNRPQVRTESVKRCADPEASVIPHEVATKPTDAKSAVAEAKAKAEAAKVQAEASKVAEEIEAKELSYQKDIQPKLVQYFKTHGKPKGMVLLSKYGAKTGDGIKVADYPALLSDIGG